MHVINEFIKEKWKKLLLIIIFVIIVLIVSSVMTKEDENKVYNSEDYIYTKDSYVHDIDFESKLPYINLDNNEINKINEELIEKYYKLITKDEEIMMYEVYQNDNILSLIVKTFNQESLDSYPTDVMIYNIDVENAMLVRNSLLLTKYDITEEEIKKIISDKIKEYYNYEIAKGYTESSCNFDCYLEKINSLPILSDSFYYLKDNTLYVYKTLNFNSDFYYDNDSGFDLLNFKIKEKDE